MKILLQFPAGLKKYALEKARELEKEGHEVFIAMSNSYGACDIAIDEARALKVDKIIHYGHAPFPLNMEIEIPVEFVEWKEDFEVEKLRGFAEELQKKGIRTLAVGAVVQYVHKLNAVKELFSRFGIECVWQKGSKTFYAGQILGCDANAVYVKADAILFIGDGKFHALAIEKDDIPVYHFNPKSGKIEKINEEIRKLKKRRKATIIKALDCKNFAILLSTKPGQFYPKVAKWIKKELEKRGKNAQIIVANEFDPLALYDLYVFDCYISTACPRIAEDEKKFEKPVLNVAMFHEFLKLLDEVEKRL